MPRQIRADQKFKDKLLKLIPSEIVAAYMVIQGLSSGIIIDDKDITVYVTWVVFAILFILTPIYLTNIQEVTNKRQIVITTGAFVIWVYSLGGGPFEPWHHPKLGAIVLVLWTLLIPFTVKKT